MIYTLLEIVQKTLSAMDSDEVDSYDDTVESLQVAHVAERKYYEMAIDLGLPEHEGLFELNASGDVDMPTLMTAPSNVVKVFNIRYDNKLTSETNKNYKEVQYLPFKDFLTLQNGHRENDADVVGEMAFTANGETFDIMFAQDKMPQFYTTFDDRTYIFDSYDDTEDTTLQKSKTMCQGIVYPTWTMGNTFTPDLNPAAFPYYLNTVIDACFVELKQQQNINAVQSARRQKVVLQKRKLSSPGQSDFERTSRNYGRK
jgi:hypothetical protein